jgi:transposase-like protein
VSQNNTVQVQAAETPTQKTETFIRRVRSATLKKLASEDKIHIVLEWFRQTVTVSDLCSREGIKPGVFYAWSRNPWKRVKSISPGTWSVTPPVIKSDTSIRGHYDLKQLAADLPLTVHIFEKTAIPTFE